MPGPCLSQRIAAESNAIFSGRMIPKGTALTDTLFGIDIYKKGFVKDPTIYFDPQAADPYGRGTYKKPYSTAAQLEAAVNMLSLNNTAHIGGQVIGFKRGSILHGGLTLKLAGASGNNVYLVPYGDKIDLPIITGATVYGLTGDPATGWATTNDSRVFKLTSAVEYDVFDTSMVIHSQRFNKVLGLTDEATVIAALIASGPGTRSYLGTTTYIYPFNGNPNWLTIEVNNVAHANSLKSALDVRYANIAATGFITIAGIHCRSAGNIALNVGSLGSASGNIGSIGSVDVVGCKNGNAGTDRASLGTDLGMTCCAIYGISDAIRMTNSYYAGNYSYNSMNNAMENGNSTGMIIERNVGMYTQGPCIAEMYMNTSGYIVRYNLGYGRYAKPVLNNTLYGHKGLWCSGYGDNQVTRYAAKSASNIYHHNIMLEIGDGMGMDLCGTGILAYNNHIEQDGHSGGANFRVNSGSDVPSTFVCNNNVLFQRYGATQGANVYADTTSTGTFSNNWYRRPDNATDSGFAGYAGVNRNGLTAIKANLDANGTNTATTYIAGRAAAGSAVLTGGVAIANYTDLDFDGVYGASAHVGAYKVGS